MASSANPYAHYNEPQIDDDDLIDPDDGMFTQKTSMPCFTNKIKQLTSTTSMILSNLHPRALP